MTLFAILAQTLREFTMFPAPDPGEKHADPASIFQS